MGTYSFSVGEVKIKENGVLIKSVSLIKDVEISYDEITVRKIGANGVPLDEFKKEESLSINLTYASNDYELSDFKDKELDLVFEIGNAGHGITMTIANCRLSNYRLRQSSAIHAVTVLTFSKRGEIGGDPLGPGEDLTKQTVKFGNAGSGWVDIGDSAYVITSYSGNVNSLVIPTALGVLLRSTATMGGGQLNITVKGYVKKDTRLELEQYLINLYAALSTGKRDLKVEYGLTSYTISDVYWSAGGPEAGFNNHTDFTLEFIKSAY